LSGRLLWLTRRGFIFIRLGLELLGRILKTDDPARILFVLVPVQLAVTEFLGHLFPVSTFQCFGGIGEGVGEH
jgi:hypothetical protein